jgi:4-amino-4-deoxy-L-arabinose transferase-like glycosyltransferase
VRDEHILRAWTALLIAGGLAVIATTVRDYGLTWDAPIQSYLGELVLAYFGSLFEDTRARELFDTRYYGPLFELVAAALYAPIPALKFELRHALAALTGLLTVLAVLRYGAALGGPATAIFASLALATLPRFYGHAFINSKDIPFACGFAWATYAMVRMIASNGRSRWVVACGLTLAAALGIRPGGLPVLGALGVAAAGYAWATGASMKRIAVASTGALALAWIGMLAAWPWAHASPLLGPLRAVTVASTFPTAYKVLFEGAVQLSSELPPTYWLRYLAITTPPLVLLLVPVGVARCLRDARSARGDAIGIAAWVLLVWLVFPMLTAFVLRPNVYDGLRHVLFVLPAVALLAGRGAGVLLALCGPRTRALVAVGLAIGLALPVGSLVRLHPYQMTYFNALVGGVGESYRRYETDYWVSSYKEAAEWINARTRHEAPIRVLVAANNRSQACFGHYLVPEVEMATTMEPNLTGALPEKYDYYVATTRYGLHLNFPDSPIVHTIGREGAVFTVIRAPR